MPVDRDDLPSTLRRSPDKVQRAYLETLESAHGSYPGDEERARRTAWAAVKHIAQKRGDRWELKDRYGPSDPQAEQGGEQARAHPKQTYGGVNANVPVAQLRERARELGIEGRSKMDRHELARAIERRQR